MIDAAHEAAILDRVRRIPIFETLRMGQVVFDAGYCELVVPRQRMYDGVFESFHGGILMTIADSAACFAVLTTTPVDQVLTTTDMNIRFLAPCLTALALVAGVLPTTPWLGLAVGAGWALHIACDRLQSGLFENGGRVEHAVAYCALVSGAACFVLSAAGWWPQL